MRCSSARRARTFEPYTTSGHSPLVARRSLRQTSFATPKGNIEQTFWVADQVGRVVRGCRCNTRQLRTIRLHLTRDALRDASRFDWTTVTHRIGTALCANYTAYRRWWTLQLGWSFLTTSLTVRKMSRTGCQSPERVQYKVRTLVYKAIHGLAPTYISEVVFLEHHQRIRSWYQLHSVDRSQNVLLRVRCYGIRFLTCFATRHRLTNISSYTKRTFV